MLNLAKVFLCLGYLAQALRRGWATKDVTEVPSVHALTFKVSFLGCLS